MGEKAIQILREIEIRRILASNPDYVEKHVDLGSIYAIKISGYFRAGVELFTKQRFTGGSIEPTSRSQCRRFSDWPSARGFPSRRD
jgi:hypothetical protein